MALTITVPVLGPPHHAAYIDRVFGTAASRPSSRRCSEIAQVDPCAGVDQFPAGTDRCRPVAAAAG
jgi:hypothetical protein